MSFCHASKKFSNTLAACPAEFVNPFIIGMPFKFVGKSLSARKHRSPASNTCFSECGPNFFQTSLVNKGFLNIFFAHQLTPFLLARKAHFRNDFDATFNATFKWYCYCRANTWDNSDQRQYSFHWIVYEAK
jgi:hypothetical protein